MSKHVALCLDEHACRNPEILGLDGESLDAQDWLRVFPEGNEARSVINEDRDINEVWVVSCDDVEPINLAASLKSDRPDLRIYLITSAGCGSLYSRAHTAHIDEVLDQSAFLRFYADAKRRAFSSHDLEKTFVANEYADSGLPGEKRLAIVKSPIEQTQVMSLPEKNQESDFAIQRQDSSPMVGSAQRRGFVLPVVSGSGGAGKSSVAVLSAYVAWRRGFKTVLLDYDLQFGDVALLSGAKNPLSVDAALAHPDQLECECGREDALVVLSAPPRLESAEEVVRGIPGLVDNLSQRFDVIVANTGAAWAEQHAALLERSSVALFLIDQRTSSVWACRHALELCARCGIASGPFRFAINRYSKGAPLTSSDVSCALQGAPVFELKDGGRDVEDCLSSGAVGELFDTGNEFAVSIDRTMSNLLPRQSGNGKSVSLIDGKVSKHRGRRAGKRRGRKAQ